MINLSDYPAPFGTTLNYADDTLFVARARPVVRPPTSCKNLADEVRRFSGLLRAACREKSLLIESASGRYYPDMLATALIGLWPKKYRPVIVLMGAMWEPDQGLRHLLQRLIVKLADRAVQLYAVQSSEELSLFPSTWGIAGGKTRFCPYFFTLTPQDLAGATPLPGDYVFAGGNSHRDYEPLLEAARHLPERRFVIATNRLRGRPDLPPNVTAGPVSHPEFVRLMRAAAVVVVPMRRGLHRAIGQQTYLNAMWLGKPTVVNDTLGVRDHVPAETALIVDGSPESYGTALRWIFDPAHQAEVVRMGARAQQLVGERFTYNHHVACLLTILDEALGATTSLKPASVRQ